MITPLTAEAPGLDAVLARLRDDDALGQLVERRGRMAELATEAGDVKLDWVDQVAWLLAHPDAQARVEGVAAGLRQAGIRHVVWAGMGGSVQCVRSLVGLGLFEGSDVEVHPLDSTDPAALNRLLGELIQEGSLAGALRRTVMVGVAMGMTSEEPITHLEWFDALLREHRVPDPASHILVMALPGSFLEQFAQRVGARQLPIQPDGASHIPGRMSAPSTHVFLLPASLALGPGELRQVLERCQEEFLLGPGLEPGRRAQLVVDDPFVRLAGWLHLQIEAGRDMVLLDLGPGEHALGPWIEQIIEESLGKAGRGLLVFPDQDLAAASAWPDRFSLLRIGAGSGQRLPDRPLAELALGGERLKVDRLAELARFFAGWSLAVAVLGYLRGITFAGQPAVEAYKRYARELRDRPGPLSSPVEQLIPAAGGGLTLAIGGLEAAEPGLSAAVLARAESLGGGPAAALAATIAILREEGRLGYLDATLNAEPVGPLWEAIAAGARRLGALLQRPVKVRSGPRDYHSTEQSETDGPPDLLSLRFLVRNTEAVSSGTYSSRFLHAQALGTVAAMRDAGRPVLLATLESRADVAEAQDLFSAAAHLLSA